MEKRPILVLVAMEQELEILVNKLDNKKETKILDYRVFEGEINFYSVVIVETLIGTINAAIATTKVIDKYNPIAIINQGTAGSHEYNIRKFDLVIGKEVVSINSIKTNVMQLGRGLNPLDWNIGEYITTKNEVVVHKANEDMLEIMSTIEEKYSY